ncbi:MAG: hypothetical protein F4Z53_13825 [Acidimicrobiales bacterium]|nr:hypothetical protein [Acidimicrobiales bacterium]MYD33931.1 hypothetical protein [Acidimicrobiales bacterium]MYI09897.1 hypothetical protein [Acidimicrobiales bacterium]
MPTRKNTLRQHARRRIAASNSDIRGVALQTVIVIVVLLVIAGGVSAVLLSRSSDVIGELENQSIGGLTAETCLITILAGDAGQLNDAEDACIWIGEDADGMDLQASDTATDIESFTVSQCFIVGGGKLVDEVDTNAGVGALPGCKADLET